MKYFLFFLLIGFLQLSCTDDSNDAAKSPNILIAQIDSMPWTSTSGYTQRSLNEGGPITIFGEGEGYALEIILGNISAEGEYVMGTNRIGKIKYGNYTYSTLDVPNAGKIIISSYSKSRIKGEFFFDAQWLNSSNNMNVTDGKFDISYY